MYHNIGEKSAFNTVSFNEFQKQMEYIKNSGRYNILSIDKYVDNLLNPSVKNSLIVTFDDGYTSLSTLVLPIIKKYEIPISVFIPVGYVGSHNVWDTRDGHSRFDILDWKGLCELSIERLVNVGSHGVNHISHGQLEEEKDYYEIFKSKKVLEKNLGNEVKYYSYPYGQIKDIGMHSINNLKKVGYKAALSTIWSRRNSKKNIYHLNRLEILRTDDISRFISKLESKIDIKYFKQRLKNILFYTRLLK